MHLLAIDGGDGDDILDADGQGDGDFAVSFQGGAGNDTLVGSNGSDDLEGGQGDDLLVSAQGEGRIQGL